MHADPIIPTFVATLFTILVIGMIARRLNQTNVVAYLLTGFLLGPHMLGVIEEPQVLSRFGSIGVIFLLFFIGMEISPKGLVKNWLISIVGTLLQVLLTILLVSLIGIYFNWSFNRIILMGFVMSLSSTAVVLKLLEEWKELHTRVGQNVLGILLVQDLLIVPMMITLSFLGGTPPTQQVVLLQVIGGVIFFLLVAYMSMKEKIQIPGFQHMKRDHELQVFASLGICFGMALVSDLLHLSAALGAFLGGMIVGSARETQWVQEKLVSIRTIFVAFFFVSVGMLIDLNFIFANYKLLVILVALTFLTNTLINTIILVALGENWKESLYGSSLLSQIGEFSFAIGSIGYQTHIIPYTTYQLMIAVIALTLFLSPPWITTSKWLTK